MIWAIPIGWLRVTLVGTRMSKKEHEVLVNSSYPFGPRHANEKPESAVIFWPFARGIRRKRLAIRGDNSILRKSSMPGPYQDTKDRFLTGCVEIRGSSSGVEHHVANVVVVGSNPISRSGVLPLGWPLSLERVGCVMADQAVPARCEPRESPR